MSIPANKSPRLVVTSANTFWKPKEAKESLGAGNEFLELKEQHGDDIEIGSVTFSEGIGAKFKRRAGGLMKVMPKVLLGAGLVGAASLAALTLPSALLLAGGLTAGLSATWLTAGLQESLRPSPVPKGISAYHTRTEPLQIENLEPTSAPGDGLRELGQAHMKLYPNSLQVVHLNGHGHGAKAVAGLPGEQAQKAMDEIVAESQKKFDVAFYETCYGSNFEFLHGQANTTDYAVAFEDPIPKSNAKTGRLPIDEILTEALEAEDGAQAAKAMAQRAGEHFDGEAPISSVPLAQRAKKEHVTALWTNTDSTAVAVDLQSLKKNLGSKLDGLGDKLTKELERPGFHETVKAARQENLLEKSGDLVDLGGFLKTLKEGAAGSEELEAALGESLQALDESLLTKRTGKDHPLSGISFHSKPNKMPFMMGNPQSPAHADPELPQGWVKFIEEAF